MKKNLKIAFIIICLLFTILSINSNASDLSWDSIKQNADAFENAGKEQIISSDKIIETVLPIGQMLTAVGVAVLFGGIIILGIKYMMADPQQKGKLKQQLIGLVVSGVVIFGAYTIWKIAYDFFDDLL